jgi:carboxypeptidase PM20D1
MDILRRRRSRVLALVAAALLALCSVVLLRTLRTGWTSPRVPALEGLTIARDKAAASLAEYIRIDTSTPPGIPAVGTPAYIPLLIDRYATPLGLSHQIVDGRGLLLRWRAPRSFGPPLVLLSHADVVPVAEEERPLWTHAPFAGDIEGGFVWGRGALDNKASTICELEAIAALQRANLVPRRDILLLVVPDEEIGGSEGAVRFVREHLALLEQPIALIDEGSFVIPDQIPGVNLVAVAVAEKQYVTIRMTVDSEAGHSSMPTRKNAPAVLNRALARLMDFELPIERLPPVERLLDRMSDRSGFGQRLLLRNRWLFGPVIERVLSSGAAGNAMLRSTHALTVLRAGIKDNVVPAHAEALVNFRLLPGNSREQVLAEIRRVIAEPAVAITVIEAEVDTPITPFDGPLWDSIEAVLATAIPEALVAPVVSPGTTDARHFARVGIPTYRLLPFTTDAGERQRVHGIDERISLDNIEQAIRVYAHLIRTL